MPKPAIVPNGIRVGSAIVPAGQVERIYALAGEGLRTGEICRVMRLSRSLVSSCLRLVDYAERVLRADVVGQAVFSRMARAPHETTLADCRDARGLIDDYLVPGRLDRLEYLVGRELNTAAERDAAERELAELAAAI